jgi:hypothetical protein
MFAIACPCTSSWLRDCCERLERLDSVSVLDVSRRVLVMHERLERLERLDSGWLDRPHKVSGLDASSGGMARHERLSRHSGCDRLQHVLESLARGALCSRFSVWGWEMVARLAALNAPEMLRRLSGARDMLSKSFILNLCIFEVMFVVSFERIIVLPFLVAFSTSTGLLSTGLLS